MSHTEEEIAELVANLALNILTNYFNVTAHVGGVVITKDIPRSCRHTPKKTSHHQGVSR